MESGLIYFWLKDFFPSFITHLCPLLLFVSLLLIFPGSSLKSSQQLSSAPDFLNVSLFMRLDIYVQDIIFRSFTFFNVSWAVSPCMKVSPVLAG